MASSVAVLPTFCSLSTNFWKTCQPIFRFAASKAREMMVKRGDVIGYPWASTIEAMREHDWEAELAGVVNNTLEYPEYYTKPFHAYEKGNLSWDAALELDLAAKAVHAPVFDTTKKAELDPDGDAKLRASYHKKMLSMLQVVEPQVVVDIGCASGLSTFALQEVFPSFSFGVFPKAAFTGVDLSPYFLSVANYRQRERSLRNKELSAVTFVHAAGEATGLPAESADLVSMCLVCHELPRTATKQIIQEAYRILKPGGAFAIMEMNPNSPFLHRMVNNVFAFTAFKATEPYFDDYRTFPIEEAIVDQGFEAPKQVECSPRHRAIVAHKL
eukprot:jgi/Mesen1/3573/ME000002S05139